MMSKVDKNLTLILLALLISVAAWAKAQDDQNATLSLPQLVNEALARNPEISVLINRLEAFEHRVKPAEALPDPAIGFSLLNYPVTTNPLDIGRFPMTQTQFSYTQSFPPFGTRRLRGQLARLDVEIEAESVAGKKIQVAAETAAAYYELYLAGRSLEIAGQNAEELEKIVEIAASKYASGQGSLNNVLDARLALSRLRTSIETLRQSRSIARARLNVVLDRDPKAPLGELPAEVIPTFVSLDFDSALDEAISNHPSLRALVAGLKKVSTGVELALKELQPSYAFRFAYGLRDGIADLWTAGVVINFPMWRGGKQRERVAEREAEERVARARLEAEKNKTVFAVRKAFDEIAGADERIGLHRETNIPLAKMTVETTEAAYKANRADLDDLLRARIALLDLELELEREIVSRELSVVDLYAAVGRMPGLGSEEGKAGQTNKESFVISNDLSQENVK